MLRKLFTFWVCCFLLTITSAASGAIVLEHVGGGIQGFEVEREVANKLLGPTTTNRTQAKIFLTVYQGLLYAQTNYIPPGFSYPTKLAVSSNIDLTSIVYYLLYSANDSGNASELDIDTIKKLIKEAISFFVERERLQDSIFSSLDFSKCKHLVWVQDRPNEVQPIRGQINIAEDLKNEGNVPINIPPTQDASITFQDYEVHGHNPEHVKWQMVVAFSFGVCFIITLIVLAIRYPEPTDFQYGVFRIILAVAASGVAAMIPGFLSLDFNAATNLTITAAGALGVFVIVYFFNPARYAVGKQPRSIHADLNPVENRTVDDSHRFSVKDGQDFKLEKKIFGADRCMYDTELSSSIVGDNAAKFILRVFKHVWGDPSK